MQSTAKILAGAAGLTTAFVAGGFAKDKFNQVNIDNFHTIIFIVDFLAIGHFNHHYHVQLGQHWPFLRNMLLALGIVFNQVKFEKAVPILPKESLAEITKSKV